MDNWIIRLRTHYFGDSIEICCSTKAGCHFDGVCKFYFAKEIFKCALCKQYEIHWWCKRCSQQKNRHPDCLQNINIESIQKSIQSPANFSSLTLFFLFHVLFSIVAFTLWKCWLCMLMAIISICRTHKFSGSFFFLIV